MADTYIFRGRRMKIEKTNHGGWGIYLSSRDEESRKCSLWMRVPGYWIDIRLPNIIQPERHWRDLSSKVGTPGYDWLTPSPDGRYGYTEIRRREYSISYGDGYLHVRYGRQTMDSDTEKSWCWSLPWLDWRFIRHSFYDLKGEHFWTEWERGRRTHRNAWGAQRAIEEACPRAVFEFDDFDGERIKATCRAEEREWRLGRGGWAWLSLFAKPKVRRSLKIDFSSEVGPEKGSWKGGTLGHGVEMLPGETPEAAFRRYCEMEHRSKYRNFRIAYVGRVDDREAA